MILAAIDWTEPDDVSEFNAAQDKLAARVPVLLAAIEAVLKRHFTHDRHGLMTVPLLLQPAPVILWPCPEVADHQDGSNGGGQPAVTTETAVYTLSDLTQDAARIMDEIEQSGKPAFITRHGRFIAMITPLKPGEVESRVLGEMARALTGKEGETVMTTDTLEREAFEAATGTALTPLWTDDQIYGYRVKQTGTHYIDILRMIFNWRIVTTPVDDPMAASTAAGATREPDSPASSPPRWQRSPGMAPTTPSPSRVLPSGDRASMARHCARTPGRAGQPAR